jgi:hypothetical protein
MAGSSSYNPVLEEELACPVSMAGSSSSNPVLEQEVTTASFSPDLDGVERARRWPMMASRDGGRRVEARAEQSER